MAKRMPGGRGVSNKTKKTGVLRTKGASGKPFAKSKVGRKKSVAL
jgi:hypothetical protein